MISSISPAKGLLLCLFLAAVCIVPAAADDMPVFPQEVYGSVTCGETPAPVGTIVTAHIDGTVCGRFALQEAGTMGGPGIFHDRLVISSEDAGATVRFRVNGEPAEEELTFTPGAVTRFNLTAPESALVPSGTHAAFTASPTLGVAPFEVRFTDLSTGDVTTWSWDFGDGTGSTEQDPVHTYRSSGIYTVSLTVNSDEDTATKPVYINVLPILLGDANDDGTIDQADTLRVLKEVVGLTEKPEPNSAVFRQTDVHANEVIEIGDALYIAQYNVGLRDPWFKEITAS
ncbi:PKD domain-containing protein [Methanofollis formosanus]|uniref:PKD domain-containing protein n=1 Tax=Methanofollis formosanus TaxID=299308 RepID=A0A8G1A166_9EURY|nr:PKD domain-containing protein [Methanofollis formosanus]QYZ78536.1 PKD domain-containing protein [Methanofollis formosanus]